MTHRLHACLLIVCALVATAGADELLLDDFETPESLKAWQFTSGKGRLVTEGATHGTHALEITFDPRGQYQPGYIYWNRVRSDWSAYDALVLDVTNPSSQPVPGYILVADKAWEQKGRTYWNRHNGQTTFAPGLTQWTIPVHGLFRGEAGSRNNDIKRNIDPDSIVRVDFGFGRKGTGGRILIDNLRLVKSSRPDGVWAFDFGPPAQSVMLGWTPVSQQTKYSPQRGYGWGPGGTPWNGAARDTTFGTMLLQDFCEAGGYNFRTDAAAGRYRVTVWYENSGYWGGEQAMHRWRRILANGREVWREDRPDGSAHALYRFEDIEPIHADIWDMYMAPELARPAEFETASQDGRIVLRFEADRVWGSKVAAIALHRADDEAGARWVADQRDALAREFRSKAVCLDAKPSAGAAPSAWRDQPLTAWAVRLEEDVTPDSQPPDDAPGPRALRIKRLAARDEYEPFCLAVRPRRSLGDCRLTLSAEAGAATLPARIQVVRYNTSRGFGAIAYRVRPHTLREAESINLPAGVTREFIITVRIPGKTEPGRYGWKLEVRDGTGTTLLRVPLELTVSPVTLDRDVDYSMGFFGLMPPPLIPNDQRWPMLEASLALLREHGMNAVSGGPSWRLTGWRDGQPQIDFGEMDRFFALLRKHGFTRPLNGYGGARFLNLHDRYQKGARAQTVERQSGLPYAEALRRAWAAVDAHARQAGWPTILYAMCDETRVRSIAEGQLEFMKLMSGISAAFPPTVRTSGSYSVHFRQRPTSRDDMLYWHQRFFENLDISSLNNHDDSVLAEARRLGKEVQIYNQGRTRYSFGLYQWSEYRRGVTARWQWHLNILHGYQFFDLDGREPDTAMICYGRGGIHPTIDFERCREGAEDFYLYNAVWKRGGEGRRLLSQMTDQLAVNRRQAPPGFDADQLKARLLEAER